MKKLLAGFIGFCICFGILGGSFANAAYPESDSPTIFIAGDSTAASYDSSRAPLAGWGQVLQGLLPNNVKVSNYAQSGRSSKSFIKEGRLDAILSEMKKGDYLVVQFGHNDQKADDPDRFTEPGGSFKECLMQYINGAISRGGIPILVTPIERRRFEGGKIVPSLGPYVKAMAEVAQGENVTLIDVNAATIRYYNALGEEGSKSIFLFLEPGESPNYPDGITDNTHLNEEGAVQVSKIFLAELSKTQLPIAKFITGIVSPAPPEAEKEEAKPEPTKAPAAPSRPAVDWPESDTPTIHIVGASTAQSYDESRAPLTGWGQVLSELVPSNVKVNNQAKSGRSSKSFIEEGLFQPVLDAMKKGDYLAIQFGHNDQKADDPARFTEADGSFKEYLRQYINGAKSRQAIPILVTSIERRRFDNGQLVPSLGPYANAMRELAVEENVPLIDVNAATIRYFNKLGEEGTKDIFLILEPGESPNYPNGITDNTHLNREGALDIAKIFLAELSKAQLPISKFITGIESPAPPASDAPREEEEHIDLPVSQVEIDTDDEYLAGYLQALNELLQIGILKGYENGELGENRNLTRAEFTAIAARVLDLDESAYDGRFSDISAGHWAAGSIAAVTEKGILSGYDDGSFRPDSFVTYDQAIKILVEALGYGESAMGQGPYPWGYLLEGAERGITADTDGTAGTVITRACAAKLIYNAFYIKNAKGTYLADNPRWNLYYVSPSGSDDGDGSFSSPWKTFERAASTLTAGQTAVFDEGIYTIPEGFGLSNSGASQSPITLRSKKEAVLILDGDDLAIEGDYVTLKGFEIKGKSEEQEITVNITGKYGSFESNTVKTSANDALYVFGADGFRILNNEISGAGISIYGTNDLLASGNRVNDAPLGGIRVYGSNSARIYNNVILSDYEEMIAGIILGAHEGEPARDSVLLNNVAVTKVPGFIDAGILYEAAYDCHSYNNAIINTVSGVSFKDDVKNPRLLNNIFSNCISDAYIYKKMPEGFTSDYNVFHNTYPHMFEQNSIFKDPMFTDIYSDWRLVKQSPALGAGTNPGSVFAKGAADLDLLSMDGIYRDGKWSIGPMEGVSNAQVESSAPLRYHPSALLLQDGFEAKNTKWVVSTGEWEVEGGKMIQLSPAASRSIIRYEGGENWTDYDFSADILSPNTTPDNTNGIIFRADSKMQNMYTFRIYGNTQLEFAKWENAKFASIYKWDYKTEPDTMYNLGVLAQGNKFTFYLNGKKVHEMTDDSYSKGTVGLYTFRQKGEFDNVMVYNVAK